MARGQVAFAAGEYARARTDYLEVLGTAAELAAWDREALARYRLAMTELHDGNPERVLALVAGARSSTRAEDRADLAYLRGLALGAQGRHREAIEAFETARVEAGKEAPAAARDALTMEALERLRYGDLESAEASYRALLLDADDPHERRELLQGLAWVFLMARELDAPRPNDDARGLLAEARALVEGSADAAAHLRAHLLVDSALEAVGRGDAAAAAAFVAASVATSTTPDVRGWQLEVQGRAALVRGQPAQAVLDAAEMIALGEARLVDDLVLRGHLLEAKAHQQGGRLGPARVAYQRAEAVLAQIVLELPHDVGPQQMLALRDRGARRWAELELRAGRPAAALAVVRRSIRRMAMTGLRDVSSGDPRALEARRRYAQARAMMVDEVDPQVLARLRAQAHAALGEFRAATGKQAGTTAPLRPVGPGEVQLTWHRVGAEWSVFAESEAGVRAWKLGALPAQPEGRVSWALGPITASVATSERVRLVAASPLQRLDLHLPLLADHPVVFASELPGDRPAAGGSGLVAIGSSSVQGDRQLAHVAPEVEMVCGAYVGPGGCRLLLDGGRDGVESASRAHVLAALGTARHLHFAGHGELLGRDGWFSRLVLYGTDALTVGDVVLAERVPEVVVLSACETGKSAESTVGGAIGLAQAFLVAGAATVIAPVDDVDDAQASALVRALQGERVWAEPAQALRRVQLVAQARAPHEQTWARFRAMEP